MKKPFSSQQKAFTLIELLLVIGIMAVLMFITILAINPSRQIAAARDTQRRSNVQNILNAVYQWSIDHSTVGLIPTIPASNTATPKTICKTTYTPTGTECVSLKELSGTYLVSIPFDPAISTSTGYTGYKISKDAVTNRVTVSASGQNVATISSTR